MDVTPDFSPDALISEIETMSRRSIHPHLPFFRHCSLICSKSTNSELRFLRAVLYLYTLECECGSKPVRFCCNQTLMQKHSSVEEPKITLKIIHALRTQAAHSLDPNGNDIELIQNASAWFRQQIGAELPTTDEQWAKCHEQLVKMGVDLLNSIKCFLRDIESDEEMAEMRSALRQAVEGGIDRVTIENIASEVLKSLGRNDLSPGAFCERNLSDWNKVLSIKSSGTDLRRAVRILIESTVAKMPPPAPFTTLEMIAVLNNPQGHLLRKLVRERDRLLEEGIVEREQLLARLSDYLKTVQSP